MRMKRTLKRMMKPSVVKVSLSIPFVGQFDGTWEPSDAERRAAWELYVELVTRISVVPLPTDQGSLRAALSSLYSLFDTTRAILKRHGPAVAVEAPSGLSFGRLAVGVLNGLRPTLTRWHPELDAHESTRPEHVDALSHERDWEHAAQLRREIDGTRVLLVEFARLLGSVAEVDPQLLEDSSALTTNRTGGGCRRNRLRGNPAATWMRAADPRARCGRSGRRPEALPRRARPAASRPPCGSSPAPATAPLLRHKLP